MRLLLDECVPRTIVRDLAAYDASHVTDMGWSGVKNGRLLRLRSESDFTGLVTVDSSLNEQQPIARFDLFIVVIRARSNRAAALRSLLPELTRVLDFAQPGQVYNVAPGGRD